MDKAARELRIALETADLGAFADSLSPNVPWGPPGAKTPTCQSKNQVQTWYERGRSSGASAKVSEVVVAGNRVQVGLLISAPRAREEGGRAARWQVYTLSDGLIVDIVGFDQKSAAVSWLSKV